MQTVRWCGGIKSSLTYSNSYKFRLPSQLKPFKMLSHYHNGDHMNGGSFLESAWPLGHFFSPVRHRPWSSQLATMEKGMREMDRDFDRLERQLSNTLGGVDATVARIEPQVVQQGDNKKYLVNVKMGKDFTPENLKVGIKDNVLTIEGKKEEVSEDGHLRRYQEVSRRFTLPPGVDAKQVKSHLDANGVLKIEAPLPQQALPEPKAPQAIPVDVQ